MKMVFTQFVIFAVSVVISVQGSSSDGGAAKNPPCSTNQKFLSDLRTMMNTYLGESTVLAAFSNIQAKKSQVIKTRVLGTGGAVFTRWGRTVCPPGNDRVYKGYAAGTGHQYKAGPATLLCLPDRPIYANYTAGLQGGSYIYGTEYQSSHTSPNVKPLYDHDMPCAVCRSRRQSSVLMVPARNECLPGWRLEYSGYLMGGHYNYAASEYICVDVNAEKDVAGHKDKNGHVMYLVESVCGSLPCPPYHNGWELTCAVCSYK